MDRSIVLVTGASRGIGEATAGLLAERGYRVFGTARRPAADRVDGFEMLPLDVTSGESVKSCVSAVLERAGGIDVLVNNAGIGLIGAVEETPVEDAAALFDANLFGAARMVNAVLTGMRQRKSGLIINFGSLAAGGRGPARGRRDRPADRPDPRSGPLLPHREPEVVPAGEQDAAALGRRIAGGPPVPAGRVSGGTAASGKQMIPAG